MSIYCIHKHGWFESGWSLEFLTRCLDRALLNVQVTTDADPAIGQFVIGSRDPILNADWLQRNSSIEGAPMDGHYLVAGERTSIRFETALGQGRHALVIHNFRPKEVRAKIGRDGGKPAAITFVPGETRLPIEAIDIGTTLQFDAETWRPCDEIGNLDTRKLAFHIGGLVPDRESGTHRAPSLGKVLQTHG